MNLSITIDFYVGLAMFTRRKELGLSSIKFADLLGIDIATVKQLETGATRPSAQLLLAIANILKVEISYFFNSALPSDTDVNAEEPLTNNIYPIL